MALIAADPTARGTQGSSRTNNASDPLFHKILPLNHATDRERSIDQQPSPGLGPALSLSLSSNNPFRNRASPSRRSPDPTLQSFPFPNNNAMSKNPFLDPAEAGAKNTAVDGNDSNSNALADDIFVSLFHILILQSGLMSRMCCSCTIL